MGMFWECPTCLKQHRELRDADRCCNNTLEERAAIVAFGKSHSDAHANKWAGMEPREAVKAFLDAIEAGEHLK